MKISYNWLQNYFTQPLPNPNEVADLLTSTGLEVEGVETIHAVKGGLEGVITGQVVQVEKHPNADALRLTKVNIGQAELLNIVCGAPNVAVGQKIVVALVGATLYPINADPITLKKAKIRGEQSEGMICAEDELGIGQSHNGILVLPDHTPIGLPAAQVLGLPNDYIFEIGLTPNRSDAYSHIGVARDLAAAIAIRNNQPVPLNIPSVASFAAPANAPAYPVQVLNANACPRYSGILLEEVKIAESPKWLQQNLQAIGVRPINNVVDITNFILHELGQPLHAFDADKIAGNAIVVNTLAPDTPFVTLDGKERKLHADDLMICNAQQQAMCIAGVFGGLNSGVTEQTTRIFLESAFFDAKYIRKTSFRHLLRTDAAQRFEKTTDINLTLYALQRASLLLQSLAGAKIASAVTDIYPNPKARTRINLSLAKLHKLTGVTIEPQDIRLILQQLDIQIENELPDVLTLLVGTNRPDVMRDVDVIEEIIRIYGLDRIPLPKGQQVAFTSTPVPDKVALQKQAAILLSAMGFNEVLCSAITNANYYPQNDPELVLLLNSLNANMDAMRKSMLPGNLEIVLHNQNHKNTDLKLFEFGQTYQQTQATGNKSVKNYPHTPHLTLLLCGKLSAESWQGKTLPTNFYDLKEVVLRLLKAMGVHNLKTNTDLTNCPLPDAKHLAYGLSVEVKGGKTLAVLGLVNPTLLKQFGIKTNEVWYADIQWDVVLQLVTNHKPRFSEVPRFPGMRRDLAVIINENIDYVQLENIAIKIGKQLLKQVNLFDIFVDAQKLGEGKKSYAISLFFQDANRTLTDKDVETVVNQIIHQFKNQLNAEIRA
ncbi:MAG: phenylalanine--tRNA ligase subunit beta [Chitinophagales bacterium]|jgi:phenylalanyl-tRNA synthetase beta chain|nr:phenylalanine--tRNA ligase subunit beta [Sphingobacteriales bacterium]MBP9141355.1 phenylalanine--tRNA ligase subunit beta [Chitinophagales bacterium]MDA0198029.1 phenylalanine--tRNA ligase subunit beta [Bacteroidota bacterium]MBK6890742.1 phenylalanine--tRNA ligase subunit beta [Sphingobacteriales bacterium]MBK8677921.1 phenylalanine--tRNA ligase subunit beta [Sphingobacteriales bacterium]